MAGQTTAVTLVHRSRGGRVRLRCPAIRGRVARAGALQDVLTGHAVVARAECRAASASVILHLAGPATDETVRAAVLAGLRATRLDGSGDAPRPSAAQAIDEGSDWHRMAADDVARAVETDPETGLDPVAAAARLRRGGENRVPSVSERSSLSLFAEQFESLPVGMLLGSSVVSLATGGVADAVATVAVVMVNAGFGYVTEGQAEASIGKLMDSSGETVTVLRGGREHALPAAHLVRGDVLVVRPGRVIPADARVVADHRLKVDESALTGETRPVTKRAAAGVAADAPLGARPTMLYSGTMVAEGRGRALVVATGPGTVAARIARLSETAARPRAPVEEELDRLGAGLVKLSMLACGVFFGIGWMRGMGLSMMLKDALALAVAAVPEGLPVVATTTMSMGLRKMERRGVLVRRIDTVESLGALQVLCLDKTGTLTRNRLEVVEAVAGPQPDDPEVDGARAMLLEVAALNSEAEPGAGGATGSSATERAVLDHALGAGLDVAALRRARPLERLIERTPERPFMVTLHGGAGPRTLVKGAPETVLRHCAALWDGTPLDAAMRARILAANDLLAARPARVLGFAAGDAAPEDRTPQDLRWLGLLAMVDPLRAGAADFITAMHRAGIKTVMITGDQAATAAAIARDLNLAQGGPLRIIDSPEIAAMNPDLLGGVAQQAHVFSRVSAAQKLAIVQALQSRGAVVGMTGDGVNDGPALKAANVGIAMGASGTDLARDVANVVIRDDELTTLIDAIAQGRAVYRNIRRALEFLIATNLSEIAVGLVEAVHGPGELESPMELLWINLVSDVLPGLGLALADPDPDAMHRPPRAVDEPVIPQAHFRRMALDGATISASALVSHFVGLARFGPGPRTRAMTFLALSLGQLLYALTCQRSDIANLRTGRLLENRMLDGALIASAGTAVLPFFLPPLRRLLKIAPLDPLSAGVGLAAAAAPSAIVLARKDVRLVPETVEVRPCATS
ncbi:Ca2+-transporting ATPase [Rhodovulum sp. ES.010]|uniref:cation-translocating P-type ATPase n=1 Tax=Rhodovulum sp. ES.010 TaxID=1882821 RepID=UPI00092C589A|nr:cation-transporting P-type ATPase [Rhodovulum sp. ES.010]SIO33697.1 Ca2+-transporting ATPase [Rhodovulum sp. ES.010]